MRINYGASNFGGGGGGGGVNYVCGTAPSLCLTDATQLRELTDTPLFLVEAYMIIVGS